MSWVTLGRLIGTLRQEAGLSQEALAARVGVAALTIARLEAGSFNESPLPSLLPNLAGAFEIPMRHLVLERDNRGQMMLKHVKIVNFRGRHGTSVYERHVVDNTPVTPAERPEPRPSKTNLVRCPECKSSVRSDRLPGHLKRVHFSKKRVTPKNTNASFDNPRPSKTPGPHPATSRRPRSARRAKKSPPEPRVMYSSDDGRPMSKQTVGRPKPTSPPRPAGALTPKPLPHPDRLPSSDSEWWRER